MTGFEFSGASAFYSFAKDVFKAVKRKFAGAPAAERLARRAKWKPIFEDLIRVQRRDGLRSDVIIRDVKRIDQYPDIEEDSRISAWFKVGLVGTYHRGIQVALSIHPLIWEESEDSWRIADWETERDTATNSYLIGFIPYDDIEHLDTTGDEYYSHPQVYCDFAHAGQPYERLAFCERVELSPTHDFYTELGSLESVRLTSEKFGTSKRVWQR